MKKNTLYVLIISIILLLLIGEVFLLMKYGQDTTLNKIGFLLQIIGFYGIGLGFVQRSDVLRDFSGIDEMTSPDPVRFIAGNFIFLSILSSLVSVGFSSNRSGNSSLSLGCLGQILSLLFLPILLIYFLFHLLVICPLAYIGYLLTSAVVESISGAADDVEYTSTIQGKVEDKISIRKIISSNPSATKSFLIGVPATFLAFIAKIIGMFFG